MKFEVRIDSLDIKYQKDLVFILSFSVLLFSVLLFCCVLDPAPASAPSRPPKEKKN